MQSSYIVHQNADHTWAVLLEATGTPIRLAGIPQTGLTQMEAELTLDMLRPKASRSPRNIAGSDRLRSPCRAVA